MTQIKNNINTYADLTAYNNDTNKDYPNVSYIQASDEVKWVKDDPVHIVAVYNVTSTSTATTLLNSSNKIAYQIIDGVKQDTVQMDYTFDTLGEHIVKYKLSGTSIGNSGFKNCTGLTSVTIPSSVTSIGTQAFLDCTSLTSATVEATTPPELFSSSTFKYTKTQANYPIYVPSESVNAYKTATNWSSYASRIQPIS